MPEVLRVVDESRAARSTSPLVLRGLRGHPSAI